MAFSAAAYGAGLSVGLGLLVAIGPQNAFVLKQGIARAHSGTVVAVCIACDILLITLGVAGLGQTLSRSPHWVQWATWGGAGFLALYGLRAFWAAWRPGALDTRGTVQTTRRGAILTTLAFTLLNPYVYLDTVVLMGTVSSRFGEALWAYWLGCVSAAVLWFASIGFLAGKLAPLFARPASWRVLDSVVGVVMCATAWHLLTHFA
jgi:L-lysine exporter family protein LysE/ArgO